LLVFLVTKNGFAKFTTLNQPIEMLQIIYILILLAIMNFYLQFRKHGVLQAGEKFMISLMSIFLLFIVFYVYGYFFSAYLDQHKQNKPMSPMYVDVVFIFMFFVMPIMTTEIVLAGYTRFVLNRKK
jgi:hypothetical protein